MKKWTAIRHDQFCDCCKRVIKQGEGCLLMRDDKFKNIVWFYCVECGKKKEVAK